MGKRKYEKKPKEVEITPVKLSEFNSALSMLTKIKPPPKEIKANKLIKE